MNAPNTIKEKLDLPALQMGDHTIFVKKIFRWIVLVICAISAFFILYYLFASDRYVSTAIIQVQNTDLVATSGLDFSAITMRSNLGATIPDQLLLKEHLVSVDMLKKLDAKLNLRAHFSDSSRDIASRMWFEDASIEWFHRHVLNRVKVSYDEFSGVIRITSEAYSPEMATAITQILVEEGERYMNEMTHALARAQVRFLETQVEIAQNNVADARHELLSFQNKKGLVSPKATVTSLRSIIAKLEEQRTRLQTQIASLPASIAQGHSTRRSLQQSLAAVEAQIKTEGDKLASETGRTTLNSLAEEEARLEEEVEMKQSLYKNALICLEKGRMDAARTLKLVAVLQTPSEPEYAWQPRRIYGVTTTLVVTLLVIGMTYILRSVVLDHVD